MTSRELYRRFISLCQKWPKDETKVNRDYAEVFRLELGKHFPHGEQSQIEDAEKVEASLSVLERLANNNYFNENVLKRSSASGLEHWACKDAISNKGLKMFAETDESSLIKRLKESLSIKFTTSDANIKDDKLLSDKSESSQKSEKKID